MPTKHHFPQYVSEFIGTFFLVFLGCGAIILSETRSAIEPAFIPIVFGGVVSIMIYALGHISGAHFNPAVTLSFWAIGRFPKSRIPGYILAQTLGALLASFIHSLLFGFEHSFGSTNLSLAVLPGLSLEVILSFLLMFVIASVATDSRAVGELAGIAIGSTVAICALVGGPLTSASMNPARTFGPAALSLDFSNLWLYILGPILGALLGAKTYEWIRCQKEGGEEKHGCC